MSSIGKSFFKGVLYTGLSKYVGIFFSIIVASFLSRLIAPKDFGVVAIATVFINFFSTLTTVGLSPAIVQNKTITEKDLKSLNTFSFVLAIVLTFIYLSVLPLIYLFYDRNTDLLTCLSILSVCIFFSISSVVPNALLLKNKEFKFIATRTIIVQFVLGCISVVMALCGFGIYALLLSPVVGSIILLVVNFVKYPIGFGKISSYSLSKILNFSFFQILFNLVYLLYRNIDKVMVGKFFGMNSLGFYEKSYRLMMLPLENVSSVVSPVLHPLLSDYQNDKEMIWNAYLKMIKTISEFCFLLSILLFFLAKPIIVVLYGDNWLPAVSIFKILALGVCFQLLQSPIGAVLQSINKVKVLFFASVILLLFIFISLLFSVLYGDVETVAYGVIVSFAFGFVSYQYYVSHCFSKSITNVFNEIIPSLWSSLGLFIVLSIFQNFIDESSDYVNMFCVCTIFILYVIVLFLLNRMPCTKDLILKILKK